MDKLFWSMPFDVPNAAARAIALLRRRDELGGGEPALYQAAQELEPAFFMSADEFVADLRSAGVL